MEVFSRFHFVEDAIPFFGSFSGGWVFPLAMPIRVGMIPMGS